MEIQRNRFRVEPALSLVPDARLPPKGCWPTTAPVGLSSADQSLEMASEAVYGSQSGKQIPQPGAAVLGTYEHGGTVVTTGSTDWVSGLKGGDKTVEQITRNILDRLAL